MGILHAFWRGLTSEAPVFSHRRCAREAHMIHAHLSEDDIDKMIEDSFPASDPPSTY